MTTGLRIIAHIQPDDARTCGVKGRLVFLVPGQRRCRAARYLSRIWTSPSSLILSLESLAFGITPR